MGGRKKCIRMRSKSRKVLATTIVIVAIVSLHVLSPPPSSAFHLLPSHLHAPYRRHQPCQHHHQHQHQHNHGYYAYNRNSHKDGHSSYQLFLLLACIREGQRQGIGLQAQLSSRTCTTLQLSPSGHEDHPYHYKHNYSHQHRRYRFLSQLCSKSSDGDDESTCDNNNIGRSNNNSNNSNKDGTKPNSKDESRQSILPPYRSNGNCSSNSNSNSNTNIPTNNKWRRGSRLTMKRPYSKNKNRGPTVTAASGTRTLNNSNSFKSRQFKKRDGTSSSILPPPPSSTTIHDFRAKQKQRVQFRRSNASDQKKKKKKKFIRTSNRNTYNSTISPSTSLSSLLPPSTFQKSSNSSKVNTNPNDNNTQKNGQFIQSSKDNQKVGSGNDTNNNKIKQERRFTNDNTITNIKQNGDLEQQTASLIPSIEDLPPPSYLFGNKKKKYNKINGGNNTGADTSTSSNSGIENNSNAKTLSSSSSTSSSLPSLDGVLPVSELFYRSTQSLSGDDDNDNHEQGHNNHNHTDNHKASSTSTTTTTSLSSSIPQDRDDEELPFSAEQSNKIHTKNNKICLRRNNASSSNFSTLDQDNNDDSDYDDTAQDKARYRTDIAKLRASSSSTFQSRQQQQGKYKKRKRNVHASNRNRFRNKKNNLESKGRKMVRRGMEMLVGGEPINADPPLRFMELHYCFDTAKNLAALGDGAMAESSLSNDYGDDDNDNSINDMSALNDWAAVITTNSRDFGPLLHKPSVEKVTNVSRQLYCEHFINACLKWQVCPKDLKALAKNHKMNQLNANNKTKKEQNDRGSLTSKQEYEQLLQYVVDPLSDSSLDSVSSKQKKNIQIDENQPKTTFRGFGKSTQKTKTNEANGEDSLSSKHSFKPIMENSEKSNRASRRSKTKDSFTLGGELKFTLGLTRAELESGHEGSSDGHILRRVLAKGIATAIKSEALGFNVKIAKLILNEIDGGATEFNVEFNMIPKETMQYKMVEQVAKSINSELAHAMDYGDMALAMGAAAKAEMAWPARVRKRIVEEFLFDDDDDDEPVSDTEQDPIDEEIFEYRQEEMGFHNTAKGPQADNDEFDGPFGMPGDTIYANDDIYLGGGNGGVFADYSEDSVKSAPWQGNLGPLLVDATTQRALQRQPRVIAIGDVHGCLDELQALLRRCDYRPGDLIVFLGDLVSKGPDSLSVVQMARELGAMGVRGNHDFEVIRWHQAIKSGADPPVVGSEHYSIASNLQKADLKWMYSLPWYISSKELSALFVHAGFVSGIRLGKQNPRLMMNMRSILPDGTVTSKFFNNWPWARLWDGPQTVLFGHDADRGLQQYEHAIGLDTGCVYGGRLTACILPEKRLVSVSARRAYFQYRRKHFD